MPEQVAEQTLDRHYILQRASKMSSRELAQLVDDLFVGGRLDEASEYAKILIRRERKHVT